MNILVTGASGMVGTALRRNLEALRDGKNRTRPGLSIGEIYAYTRQSTVDELDAWCEKADFVFHLAGVNRPKDAAEFMAGNFGLSEQLLGMLKKHGNRAPVMLASSTQASLCGRFANSEYGKSKRAGEELFFAYGAGTGAKTAVYRFPNLMGHSRPNYNSAVSTFCYNLARDLPITVNDRSTELELLYIDDLIEGLFDLLEGKEQRCDYDGLDPIPNPAKVSYALKMNVDPRGSFTELLHTRDCGQVSVNITKPGVTKGNHWHNSKWEQFIVVHGRGLIRERNLSTGEVLEFEVSGEKIESVYMLPGWTHSIENLSDTEDLVTVMTCNEIFDPARPDTFFEPV